MKIILDLFPILLFFAAYKYASIYEDKLDVYDRNNQYHFKALQNKPVAGFEPVNDDFNM